MHKKRKFPHTNGMKTNAVKAKIEQIKERNYSRMKVDFLYCVWLFFLLSIFGWLWEGFLYLFKDDIYVNRGFMNGPWLPIYGMGGIMLELLFHKWRDRPFMIFVSSMLLCTVLEYLAGWYLELTWGVKWWDYSDMPWNLHGRICVFSSLLFGVGGMLLVWVISPLFYLLYRKIPVKIRVLLGLSAIVVFAADAAYSAMVPHAGAGITYR
ncbi:MAG: putative ABC transporter permease [Lachnospiraceae bacterium]|nr:putative ABC transporter permease [Lachnospiraceae bacterium]